MFFSFFRRVNWASDVGAATESVAEWIEGRSGAGRWVSVSGRVYHHSPHLKRVSSWISSSFFGRGAQCGRVGPSVLFQCVCACVRVCVCVCVHFFSIFFVPFSIISEVPHKVTENDVDRVHRSGRKSQRNRHTRSVFFFLRTCSRNKST